MAADVSRQIKNEAQFGLITRDFLNGIESKEFDLDLHVPFGWEKRLNLKSGKVSIERCSAAKPVYAEKLLEVQNSPDLDDLNTPYKSSTIKPTMSQLQKPNLDLNLLSSTYTSVCTLEKVKSALNRAERASPTTSLTSSSSRKRPLKWPSTSLQTAKGELSTWPTQLEEGLLVAAACPCCLLYVLISKNDPKCPKCCSVLDLPHVMISKKPKIDLNISM